MGERPSGRVESLRFPVQVEAGRAFKRTEGHSPPDLVSRPCKLVSPDERVSLPRRQSCLMGLGVDRARPYRPISHKHTLLRWIQHPWGAMARGEMAEPKRLSLRHALFYQAYLSQ